MKQRLRRNERQWVLSPIRFKQIKKEIARSTYEVGAATRKRLRALKGAAFRAYYESKRRRQISLTQRESNGLADLEFFDSGDLDQASISVSLKK